jgi:prepilin-type N-terminal cleavage/methylation domain-containing protein
MKRNRRGFTLVELLAVIAIIGVLAALLLGGVMMARNSAKMARCKGQLKQFSAAIDTYKYDWDQDYPWYLSRLFPSHCDNSELFICPTDWSDGADGGVPNTVKGTQTSFMPAAADQFPETDDTENNNLSNSGGFPTSSWPPMPYQYFRNQAITRCSYLYEFSMADCSFGDAQPGDTWCDYKQRQMKEGAFGHVPIVRCFWHAQQQKNGQAYVAGAHILNVGVGDRGIFFSRPKWEDDL